MKPGIRFDLQTRYSVQILAVIIVSVACISAVSVWELRSAAQKVESVTSLSFETHLEEQLAERGQVMSEYLARDLANAVMRFDMLAMRDQLQATVSQQDVSFAYIFDADGKVIHDGSNEVMKFGQPIESLIGWSGNDGNELQQRMLGELLHVVRPIRLGQEKIGGIAIGLSLGQVGTEIGQLRKSLHDLTDKSLRRELTVAGLITLLFLIGGTIFALFSGRRLANPIRQLAELAGRVGQGDFHSDLVITRNDEVGDLAKAFQSMSSDLQASNKEIQFLAYHDPLTGLANRARLKESITRVCAHGDKTGSKAAILFIDLDDFKPVNDSLGHDAGDALLCQAADRLQRCLSDAPGRQWRFDGDEHKSIARLGGDEFTVILQDLNCRADAGVIAEKIVEQLCQPFMLDSHEVTIGASIGIATYPDDGRDHESLLAHADVAMYNAKRQGKHAYCHYEKSMFEQTRDRLFMINDLRRALDSDGFEVHYQPIVSGKNGRIVGAEALVRWRHPERGLINAAEFIEVAEKSGEIERLGRWVMERVCADLAEWRNQGIDGFFVSINVSSRQLLRTDLADLLSGLLTQYGLGPRDLIIEASESRLLRGLGSDQAVLAALCDAGFEIWVDQFGSGAASLLSLQSSQARGIKLSPDFISDVDGNPRSQQFVAALIQMARSVDLKVCAVGVRSTSQASWLREQGCHYLQGYCMGADLQAVDLAAYLDPQPASAKPAPRPIAI